MPEPHRPEEVDNREPLDWSPRGGDGENEYFSETMPENEGEPDAE